MGTTDSDSAASSVELTDPDRGAPGDPVRDPGGPGTIERRLVAASLVCAVLALVAISWATAAKNHSFGAFSLWVGLILAAGVCGVVALVRLPRTAARRNLRRLATLGTVVAVLGATLGLAVYSSSRADDCPRDGSICTIRQPKPGERDQQP
jgi:hypothetical protein